MCTVLVDGQAEQHNFLIVPRKGERIMLRHRGGSIAYRVTEIEHGPEYTAGPAPEPNIFIWAERID